MNWDIITGSAEVFGAVAVLITLFYLARQIRLNTEEIRSSNYHGVTDSFNDLNRVMAENTEVAKVFRLGNESYEELSDDEKVQYGFIMHSAFRILDVIKFQSQRGTGDTTLWEFEKNTLVALLRAPGCRQWWRERPFAFSEDFVAHVEANVLSDYQDAV
ncbi:MAG: hypothetical protein ACU84Q_14480 [Gammaproteobacteria bacterium]